MVDFTYAQPVKIYFGSGKLNDLGEIARQNGYETGALIADSIFIKNGLATELKEKTPCIVGIFSEFSPNPMLSEVRKAADKLKEWGVDFVVALGGGSALDLAKFACSMVYAQHDIREYFFGRKVFSPRHLPLFAVPSTAGTGSEVTSVSVCNDDETGIKSPLSHKNFLPEIAIVDSSLTLSVPPFVTAQTGIDALSHALEALWSVNHQPICDLMAIASCKLIFSNLEKAYLYGDDAEVRDNMSLAALYAGLAFSQTKTAACHACSYPLSIDYKLAHGEACGFTLDSFVRLNAFAEGGRIESFAKEIGFTGAFDMADKLYSMKKNMGLKCTLAECGIKDITGLSEKCIAHPLMKNNSVEIDRGTMIKIFENLR